LHEIMTTENRTEVRETIRPENRAESRATTRQCGAVRHFVHSYLELFELRLTALVVLTTAAGFVAGSTGPIRVPCLLWTLLGTGLCAAGANALNQRAEVARDARMERTRRRPLPAGRMSPRHALGAASLVLVAGLGSLALRANLITTVLAAVVVVLYILAYTPLKPRTSFCTPVGAFCGAIPPMMGWTGAAGTLGAGAWILGGLLFFWQIPHFLALAWLYREDYARGGFRMLPAGDPTGRRTGFAAVLGICILVPWGLAVTGLGLSGPVFAVGSVGLGAGLLVLGARMCRERSARNAQRLFLGSIIYLPLLLGLLVANR
jgi:heme o synthase